MISAPPTPRAAVFVDGQNLFHSVRAAFGYTFPNYDALALADALCRARGWLVGSVNFYTGLPDKREQPEWTTFWAGKLSVMGRQGVRAFTRPLRYRIKAVALADGSIRVARVGEEKGIDVRIALDVLNGGYRREFDVAVIISQDQDLAEVADDIRAIAREQQRWIKIASAYPVSATSRNRRGIDKTDWIPIDRASYDLCIDRRDYRIGAERTRG